MSGPLRCYYDFHIHTALSPCADDDMTPNNVVGMAAIKGLTAIAITDHNTVGNVRAAQKVGQALGVTVIAGMEVETAEEVHVVTLFPTVEQAEAAAQIVRAALPPIANRPDLFGNQLLMDEDDHITGTEPNLLITATTLDLYQVVALAKEFGGVAVPAHLDRHSYSVLSNLGLMPEDLEVSTVELSKRVDDVATYVRNKQLERYRILQNSDAHQLGVISEKQHYFPIFENNAQNILQSL